MKLSSMKIYAVIVIATVVGRCVSECPGLSVVHPETGHPLQCQFHEQCLSVSCHTDTLTASSPLFPLVAGLVIYPCDEAIEIAINGSTVSHNVNVRGESQVEIREGDDVLGHLQVLEWDTTDSALQFGIEIQSFDPEDIYPLFFATLNFDKIEFCDDTDSDSSDSQQSAVSITTSETPLCDVLHEISRLSDMCRVVLAEDSCQTIECNVDDYYLINVMIIPCGETPGVNIEVYDALEEVTLLHRLFTTSQQQIVDLGEVRLFRMDVNIQQSPLMDHITFMLEMVFPWEEVLNIIPTTLIPIVMDHCPNSNVVPPAESPKNPTIVSSALDAEVSPSSLDAEVSESTPSALDVDVSESTAEVSESMPSSSLDADVSEFMPSALDADVSKSTAEVAEFMPSALDADVSESMAEVAESIPSSLDVNVSESIAEVSESMPSAIDVFRQPLSQQLLTPQVNWTEVQEKQVPVQEDQLTQPKGCSCSSDLAVLTATAVLVAAILLLIFAVVIVLVASCVIFRRGNRKRMYFKKSDFFD